MVLNFFQPLEQINVIIFGISLFLKGLFQDFFKTLRQEHFSSLYFLIRALYI